MFEPNKPVEIGKVIRILDKYTLLINAGKKTLTSGSKVQVYELGEKIRDLDNSIIGYYVFIKDELNVIQVEENYSICKKEKIVQKGAATFIALSPMLDDALTEKEPLNINSSDISPISPPADRSIHIGDSVKLA